MIDLIVARHEKRSKDVTPSAPGDAIDRKLVRLSPQGYADAMALGEREFRGRNYDHVFVLTSNLIRTGETAKAILEGAGFDVERDLYGNSRRATFVSTDKIGLGGTKGDLTHCPPFGEGQDVLNTYVNHVLRDHWLERLNSPERPYEPVMARRGAALLEGISQGIEEMAVSLTPQQNGLIVVVTHAPTIDALAALYTGNIDLIKTDRVAISKRAKEVKDAYTVALRTPMQAHDMGQYMRGQFDVHFERDREIFEMTSVPLVIKGAEFRQTIGEIRELAHEMNLASYHGVQL